MKSLKGTLGLASILISSALSAEITPLPQDANGYTRLTPSSDSKLIFVGTAADVPQEFRNQYPASQIVTASTANAGKNLMRAGYPDFLFLKRGAVYNESLVLNGMSGRSATERGVITAYGSLSLPRPILRGPGDACIYLAWNSLLRNFIISDLACENFANNGIGFFGRGANILIENLFISGIYQAITVFPVHNPSFDNQQIIMQDIVVRRNYLANAGGARGQGIYMSSQHDDATPTSNRPEPIHLRNVLIEQNVLYKNGGRGSGQAHNIYIGAGVRGIQIKDNISMEAATFGMMSRGAGEITNNLIVKNPIGIMWGSGGIANDGDCCDPSPAEPLTGSVRDNVILNGTDINTSDVRGHGINVAWIAGGGTIRGNIMSSNLTSSAYPVGISFGRTGSQPATIRNVALQDNIFYNWRAGIYVGDVDVAGLSFVGNKFLELSPQSQYEGAVTSDLSLNSSDVTGSGNRASVAGRTLTSGVSSSLVGVTSAPVSFSQPNRNVESYQQSLTGTASYQAFVDKLRTLDKGSWDSRYTATAVNTYIRTGFDIAPTNPQPQCPADKNGDNAVTVEDLVQFMQTFEQGLVAADLDNGSMQGTRDGGVDINDLLYYLQRFESGC